MDVKTTLKAYFDQQKQIYDYFGYKEDWVVIPIENRTDDYWMLIGDGDKARDKYVHSPEPLTEKSVEAGDNIYSGHIYCQRFLPKWVYRGEDYTMICGDTRTDGNKFLMIFDNKKECKEDAIKTLYNNRWDI